MWQQIDACTMQDSRHRIIQHPTYSGTAASRDRNKSIYIYPSFLENLGIVMRKEADFFSCSHWEGMPMPAIKIHLWEGKWGGRLKAWANLHIFWNCPLADSKALGFTLVAFYCLVDTDSPTQPEKGLFMRIAFKNILQLQLICKINSLNMPWLKIRWYLQL